MFGVSCSLCVVCRPLVGDVMCVVCCVLQVVVCCVCLRSVV